MKRGIFNKYVNYVCSELGISKKELFSRSRAEKLSRARFLLYSVCYQRPMSIIQIVDLMSENGYSITRQNVEYGISKINESEDIDVLNFIDSALDYCNEETIA